MHLRCSALAALPLLSILALAACASNSSGTAPVQAVPLDRSAAKAATRHGLVYVANEASYGPTSVYVYGKGSAAPIETITSGIQPKDYIKNIGVDDSGFLYVTIGNHINVYAPGSTLLERTIQGDIGSDSSVFVAGSGTLFVTNLHHVGIILPGASAVASVIDLGSEWPATVAFDPAQNVYVRTQHYIREYSPDGARLLRVTAMIHDYPCSRSSLTIWGTGVAVDVRGTLFACTTNLGVTGHPGNYIGFIHVFAPGSATEARAIQGQVFFEIAVDPRGTLYVLTGSRVLEYLAGRDKPSRILNIKASVCRAIAIDANQNLDVLCYVNQGPDGASLKVYPPGSVNAAYEFNQQGVFARGFATGP